MLVFFLFFLRTNLTINVAHPVFLMHTQSLLSGYTPGTDYRKVNAVTIPDCFPLPRMEDCIDNLGSARYVSKLDLLKGYWQVPLTSRAPDISAFVTPDNF